MPAKDRTGCEFKLLFFDTRALRLAFLDPVGIKVDCLMIFARLFLILWVVLSPYDAIAGEAEWEAHHNAGVASYQGDYRAAAVHAEARQQLDSERLREELNRLCKAAGAKY